MDGLTLEASNSIKRLRLFCFDASYYKLNESGRNINSSNYAFYDQTFEESDGVKSLSLPIEDFKFNCVYEAWTIFYSSPYTTKRTSAETYSLYDSEEFQAITYDGDDLGVTFNEEKTTTTFKVWAPNSALVRLNLYTKGNGSSYETDLTPAEKEEYDTPYRRPLMEIDENGVYN